MQRELQNKQKEKCKIHKNDQVAPQVRIPPSARATWFPPYPGKSASGVWSARLKGKGTRNSERRSIFLSTMNYKGICFPGYHFPARSDISRYKLQSFGATEAHGTGSARYASTRCKHSSRTTPEEKFQLIPSWSWSHQPDRPCVSWNISS